MNPSDQANGSDNITGPVAPSAPIGPTPTTPPAQYPQPTQALNSPSTKSKRKPLLVGIIAAAVVFIVAAVLLWLFIFSPAAQASRASNAFMKALTAKDMEKAYSLAGANDDDTKEFLDGAASSSEGSYNLKSKAMKDNKGYFLYNLSNQKGKQGRTTVEKEDGKYKITSYVYGSDDLALIPNKKSAPQDTAQPDTTVPAPAPAVAQTTTLTCLVNDDYKWFNYNKEPDSVQFDATYDPAKYTNNKSGAMFFKPDSLQEDSFTSIYDDWAEFAAKNVNKQWEFRLEGSTYGKDAIAASSKQLANQRAEKVKTALSSRGVLADRITIDPPHDYGIEVQDESKDQIYRRVTITIDPTCKR